MAMCIAPQRGRHRAIATEWLQRAINEIGKMQRNEDTRQKTAQRLF
jgi:hypothetical protein